MLGVRVLIAGLVTWPAIALASGAGETSRVEDAGKAATWDLAAGADSGAPIPVRIASLPRDDPEAREAWFFRQRAYPFDSFPASAYADAAEEYVRMREVVRKRHLLYESQLVARAAHEPESLPTGPWSEIGPSPIFEDGSQTGLSFGNVAGRMSAVAVHPTNFNVVIVGGSRGGIWRTTDLGGTWTPVGDDQATLVIADIKFALSNPSIVYAATGDDDTTFWGAGVLKSTDEGLHWLRADNGTQANGIPNGTVLSKLTVDPTDPNKVVAAGYALFESVNGNLVTTYIFRTVDGGVTWQNRSGNLPNVPANDILPDPLDAANTWYVGLDVGVYGTSDGGATWSVVGSNLPAVWVNDLDLGANRILYAATGGRSVWRIALPGSVPTPAEVSASTVPLIVTRTGGDLELSWQDMNLSPQSCNIYEGEINSWFSHMPIACHLAPPDIACSGGRCTMTITPGPFAQYYLITSSGPGGESPKAACSSVSRSAASLADFGIRRLRYPELPLEGSYPWLDRIGLPDQIRDARVPRVVGVDAHPFGRLALLDENPQGGRLEVVRGLPACGAFHEPGIRAAEIPGRVVLVLHSAHLAAISTEFIS